MTAGAIYRPARRSFDFEWNWPKKIDRPLIERALTLDFLTRGRNLILCGAAGLGKTMIAKNIAYAAVKSRTRSAFALRKI